MSRPKLILFDEPTSGLDPITATTVDDEIIKTRDIGHVTSVIVTHQVRDALYIARHAARAHGQAIRIVPADAASCADARLTPPQASGVNDECPAAL